MRATYKLADVRRAGGTCVVFRHNKLWYVQVILKGRVLNSRLDLKASPFAWFDVGLMTTERIRAFELLLRNNIPFSVKR